MFTASADLYDLVYSGFKGYATETAALAKRIREDHPKARSVLDVACGTGEHARRLAEEYGFEVDGLDLDPAFARIARGKLPRATVYEGDMVSFDVPKRYDAILCLFGSIGYVRTLDNVRRTLERFRAHLADSGIVLVEPWFPPGMLSNQYVAVRAAQSPEVSVARMSLTEVDDRMSRLHFEYLIGRPTGIERASEVHELGLFTTDEMIVCSRQAGFEVTHDAEGLSGRGLFVARAATIASAPLGSAQA
jgi:SAM-dependent methyltransferase